MTKKLHIRQRGNIMLCKKCGGNLVYIEETIVQCENCLAKYRVKPRQATTIERPTENPVYDNQPQKKEEIVIDHTKPFSSSVAEQEMIDEELEELSEDELNRTLDEDVKKKLLPDNEEVELEDSDIQNRQDVNDVIKEYEEEIYPDMRPILEKIYCSSCSKPVDLKTGVCPNCGNVMPLPERQIITCPYCQYDKNNIYSEFCIKCGKDLDIERDRLGITLKSRAKKVPVQTGKPKKKKEESEDVGQRLTGGKIFASILTVIMLLVQGGMFFFYKFITNGDLNIDTGNSLFDFIKASTKEDMTEVVKNFGITNEGKIALLVENSFIKTIMSMILLIFVLSVFAYAISSLYGIFVKKAVSKPAKSIALINFFCSLLLLGFGQLMSFWAISTYTIGAFSSTIMPIISLVVTFISFVIL